MAFQRKSHILNDSIYPIEDRKHVLQRPMWIISFTTFLTANIVGSIFTIGYLPIVILAPIGAMGLAFNAIAAKIVLGDPLKKYTMLGTLLIVIGALLVGLFGVISEPDHDINDLITLYKKPTFIVYFSILEFFILSGLITTHYFEYTIMKKKPTKSMENIKKYCGMSYGILSGNISSQSMLFAKSGIELIILSIASDENQLKYALTWILLAMMIMTAILQLFYLNKGLQLCDTVILVPLSSCTFNLSCLFNGLFYYDQWNRIVWWHLILVFIGVAITISGVFMISFKTPTVNILIEEEEEDIVNTVYAIMTDDLSDDTLSENTHLIGPNIKKHYSSTTTTTSTLV
ncbi:magnesium transporter NIPA-domain-containing protein [Cokeromyces recurvatus]|uniref:magnesium transporter NIPA-domain-containing protein n=1 Tax=Cokeromyces recurvatus TaxID=90255 RepID=UPI00221E9CCF|nr:magnesium transporter NIPA-domain-containing protein [Cokeromyces recurvatus]KAI7902167.1 magnesium transporter NIPA-domain-containing protein [Cokeromyces recurvatus]